MLRAQAARLLAVDREASGTRLLLLKRDEAGVGGAEGSALRVADASVADRHAIIRYAHGRYYAVDLKSAGGTFLNGRRIRRRQALKHGDILRFGGAAPYRFIDPDALKRRRWRKILRAGAIMAAFVAVGLADHFENWGLVSRATVAEVVAWVDSPAASKHVELPTTKVASAPAPAASIARAPNTPAASASAAALAAPAPAAKLPASSATTNISASSPATWLERINFYRSGLGLDPIRDNSELSAGAAAHAQYLLLNFAEDIRSAKPMSGEAYEEKRGTSGYSVIGASAAPNLQLAWGCSSNDAGQQIDHWIEGPFHRLAMLDPFLAEAGFGQVSSDGCWVATLRLPPPPEEVKPYARAVEFPPDGAAVALDWIGLEAPDPLASCPGYERPVGLPITLQIGRLADTKLSAHSLMEDDKPIEHCAFDAPSYRNPNATAQEYGRWNLRNASAVVIVPRSPLRPGSRYSVSITAKDKTYAWSFTVADTQATTFTAIAKFLTTPAPLASPATEPTKGASSTRLRRAAKPSHRASSAAIASAIALESPGSTSPTSSPITKEAPGTASTSSNWLTVMNAYRKRLNVPPVEEDPALSEGCLAHAKYLMTNYSRAFGNLGILMHEEDESKPGYSTAGLKAARASDVLFQARTKSTDAERMARAIEVWISGPFHRVQIVNPDLRRAGFAQYCHGSSCVSALDATSGSALEPPGGRPLAEPIEVPPDGVTVKPAEPSGEWPDPVSSCPGYSKSALAITLQLGLHVPANISDASLTQTTDAAAGTKVETCAYDSESYTNPDSIAQARGREVLSSFGEVIMMVRNPLAGGVTYRVAMTVNGKPYIWSFTAAL